MYVYGVCVFMYMVCVFAFVHVLVYYKCLANINLEMAGTKDFRIHEWPTGTDKQAPETVGHI